MDSKVDNTALLTATARTRIEALARQISDAPAQTETSAADSNHRSQQVPSATVPEHMREMLLEVKNAVSRNEALGTELYAFGWFQSHVLTFQGPSVADWGPAVNLSTLCCHAVSLRVYKDTSKDVSTGIGKSKRNVITSGSLRCRLCMVSLMQVVVNECGNGVRGEVPLSGESVWVG